ncbi:uncharacterized protein LOC110111082 isoform X1 [Dendrobium catenatum]|uniref:tRNA-uridine aminocarboxypropyltransferase n=1 Tax=Dendrobium catenatum TaxID=906689 RepID=A0A2I0W5K9_9ASPA|nr:uncharacterized protein LOC110111082 isoform X1 [Dendrobium catenatum]PKU70948.1 hypothetical protein MA16_Dca016251 [Dendrobium catenatum]
MGTLRCRNESAIEGAQAVSLTEWQRWGTSSPVPAMVNQVIDDLRVLTRDADTRMCFGGLGGKPQGNFRIQEDIRHREVYQSLTESEEKLQFFAARQIACRLLGSRGYLCQKCWIAMEDCMCSMLVPCIPCMKIRFWVYMHPKDFLRQNNTGKLLWQLFGVQAASLCLFGIHEHEEIMWDAFRAAGRRLVWFLYPNQNTSPKSVKDIFFNSSLTDPEGEKMDQKKLNFVLIDGTWSNSAAMYRRLKERWAATWGEKDPPCISLSSTGASVMHKLRPQPGWDRTCTAAAAGGLLSELHHHPVLQSHGLDKHAENVENALDVLLKSLTARRLRMGRSINRKERHNNCI